MNSIEIYKNLSHPPKNAIRQIQGGKLRGKSDINPQWRYKVMTEQFGLCGIGWKYEIRRLWTEKGADGEVLAFAEVAVFIKSGDVWSDAIVGIGGSTLIQLEKGKCVSNDEGYKMAVTDAFSTALKMIGVAAAIYEGLWDGAKYTDSSEQYTPQRQQQAPAQQKQKPETLYADGNPATDEQRAQLRALKNAKNLSGKELFSPDEFNSYMKQHTEKTAAQMIAMIEGYLRNRRADAPELPENRR